MEMQQRVELAKNLQAYMNRSQITSKRMAELCGVSTNTIKLIRRASPGVADKTLHKVTPKYKTVGRIPVDCARERIRNFIDDHPQVAGRPYSYVDFASAVGRPAWAIKDFLSDDESRMYELPLSALRVCARVMRVSYAKLVSQLTTADYVEEAGA